MSSLLQDQAEHRQQADSTEITESTMSTVASSAATAATSAAAAAAAAAASTISNATTSAGAQSYLSQLVVGAIETTERGPAHRYMQEVMDEYVDLMSGRVRLLESLVMSDGRALPRDIVQEVLFFCDVPIVSKLASLMCTVGLAWSCELRLVMVVSTDPSPSVP